MSTQEALCSPPGNTLWIPRKFAADVPKNSLRESVGTQGLESPKNLRGSLKHATGSLEKGCDDFLKHAAKTS